jgi:hypothetical protein
VPCIFCPSFWCVCPSCVVETPIRDPAPRAGSHLAMLLDEPGIKCLTGHVQGGAGQ